METYLQTLIGVFVSIFLFFIGYRQTVGAKRERIRAANTDIEKTLLRRIVLDSYKPLVNEISRLIEGKARDYKVRVGDLLSPSQFLGTLFTRILETDFVTSEQREKILVRINPVLLSIEEKPPDEELVRVDSTKRRRTLGQLTLVIMGIVTSLVGTFVSFSILRPSEFNTAYFSIIAVVFGVSIAIISLFLTLQRIKEKQEDPKIESPIESAIDFELEVGKVIKNSGFKLVVPVGEGELGFDYIAQKEDKKIIVEVKAWLRRPPLAVLRDLAFRLQGALKMVQASDAIIVTKDEIGGPEYLTNTNVKIMSLKLFRNYLLQFKA